MLFGVVIGASMVFILGVVLLVLAFREPVRHAGKPSVLMRLNPRSVLAQRRKLTSALAAGAVAGLASGWPVAALAAGLAVWFAPVLLGGDAGERERIARIEAVAVWAEMLRDTLTSAAGLEQAVLASTMVAPEAIAGPLANLGSDLRARRPFADAMAAVADALADATADQVVSSLVHAQRNQAKNLAELLGELAAAARAQVTLAVRVHAERAKHRASQRTITVIFSGMAVLLAVAYPRFLRPYDTAAGQLVMLVLLGMFSGALAWMRRIVRPWPTPRLLAPNGWENT
jgi:Flp pilus assembly protein TadB